MLIADDAVLHFLSNTIAAGTSGIGSSGEEGTPKYNYFQKIVTSLSTTDFENFTPKFGGTKSDFMKRALKRKSIEQARKIEKAVVFGRAKAPT